MDVLLREPRDASKSAACNRAEAARSRRRGSSECRHSHRSRRSARAPEQLASATVAAVATAMTREAGLAGRTLLGDRATIMWGEVRSLASRDPSYGPSGSAVNTGPARCGSEAAPRNPLNTAAAGRIGKAMIGLENCRVWDCMGLGVKGEVMLEKAKSLLQPSARSAVPPFMVMDVMAAAARLEAQGRRIIHMEVGQPAAGAPATAIAAVARGALRAVRTAIPKRSASLRCGGASRAPMPNGTASTSIRSASSSPPARRPASCSPFSPPSKPAIASRWRCRAIRPIATSSRRSAASRSCIETTAQTRWSITGDSLLAQHRARPLKGVIVGVAGQSDRNDDDRRGARRADPLRRRCRHRRHIGRDLSRPRLRLCGRERRAHFAGRRSSSIRFPNISA